MPWGFKVIWALVTQKCVRNDSKIQKIVIGAIYSKQNSRTKTATLVHITNVYNQMSVKYQNGLHCIG